MDEDLEDTVIVVPRGAGLGQLPPDLDDTIIVGPGATAPPPEVAVADEPAVPEEPRGDIHRFSVAGATYRLDAPAIIGRNPRGPRVPTGESVQLVTVPSVGSEVSSSHVEVRQRGASVIVTDLRSTNGSSVTIPLSQPRTLRQGESIVVSPGSFVDIGDGNIIQILPLTDGSSAGRQP